MAEKILAWASADEFARAAYQQRRKLYLDRVFSEKYLIKQGIQQVSPIFYRSKTGPAIYPWRDRHRMTNRAP